jgi:hypothetical protein
MTIAEMQKKLQQVAGNLPEIAAKAAKKHLPEMKTEIQEQLQVRQEKAEDGKAKPIGYYKGGSNSPYVKRKKRSPYISKYFAPPKVDLWLTGDFNRGLQVDVSGDKYEIKSEQNYAEYLEIRYGVGIMDYTPESKDNLKGKILPEIATEIKEKLK